MNARHLIVGVIFWIAVVVGGFLILRAELGKQSSSVTNLAKEVSHWATGNRSTFHAICDEPFPVAINDPIFLRTSDGTFRQAGYVSYVPGLLTRDPQLASSLKVELYDQGSPEQKGGVVLEYHSTPTALDWVVKTMIPPERQQQIAELIAERWQEHQQEVMAQLRPVMQQGLREAIRAVEDEIPHVLKAHEEQFRQLTDRYEEEVLRAELIPLVRREILPVVEDEAMPVAEEVGRALWKRVSLWSFTWRYLYDKAPLPKRDALKTEFQRFVDEEALPELRSRTDQFIEMLERIVKRSMENPNVREVLTRNLKRVASDAEIHALVKSIVRAAVTDNQTLHQRMDEFWKTEETRAAVRLAGDRLEPTVREIGDMIFGNRETGITPEFSRVLRSQILQKDRRWFVIVPERTSAPDSSVFAVGQIRVSSAAESMPYPMGFRGYGQSPLTPIQ
ncbi:MAG: hypothetical protein KDA81_11100 [Planctomycetaceae bacterium]|nr:hypothetical protein [Planctomycetaceae bacterium]